MIKYIKNLMIISLLLFYNIAFSQDSLKIMNRESVQSLYIEIYHDFTLIGTATGFVIKSKTQYYLVTNLHVLAGIEITDTKNKPDSLHRPNRIEIYYFSDRVGKYIKKSEPILDKSGKHLWRDNISTEGDIIDVVELPLHDTSNVKIYPIYYNIKTEDYYTNLAPTDILFVVGFPLSLQLSSLGFPLWESGTIASEPDANNLCIWVDAPGYPGMSGSPVYYIAHNVYNSYKKAFLTGHFFVGVYSGYRSASTRDKNDTSKIIQSYPNIYGLVWKASYLREVWNKLP